LELHHEALSLANPLDFDRHRVHGLLKTLEPRVHLLVCRQRSIPRARREPPHEVRRGYRGDVGGGVEHLAVRNGVSRAGDVAGGE
jgi:hypothetical protein